MSDTAINLDEVHPSRLAAFVHRSRAIRWLLLLPCLVWMVAFFVAPLGMMGWQSLAQDQSPLAAYRDLVTSPQYIGIMIESILIATLTTLVALALGYPVAYALAMTRGFLRGAILAAVTIPGCAGVITGSFSWMLLLGSDGGLNRALLQNGLAARPLPLLHNVGSLLLGTIQIALPLMIAVLFVAMLRIDQRTLLAAKIHGATDSRIFRAVFLPLSLPGVYAACTAVFVVTLGLTVAPLLLGGPSDTMIAPAILADMNANRIERAAAAGVVLLLMVLIAATVFGRLFGPGRLHSGDET